MEKFLQDLHQAIVIRLNRIQRILQQQQPNDSCEGIPAGVSCFTIKNTTDSVILISSSIDINGTKVTGVNANVQLDLNGIATGGGVGKNFKNAVPPQKIPLPPKRELIINIDGSQAYVTVGVPCEKEDQNERGTCYWLLFESRLVLRGTTLFINQEDIAYHLPPKCEDF